MKTQPRPDCHLIQGYRRYLMKQKRTTKTIELRIYWLRRVRSSCGELASIRPAQLESFLARDFAPETRRSVLASLRDFYSWARETGRVAGDRMEALTGQVDALMEARA